MSGQRLLEAFAICINCILIGWLIEVIASTIHLQGAEKTKSRIKS